MFLLETIRKSKLDVNMHYWSYSFENVAEQVAAKVWEASLHYKQAWLLPMVLSWATLWPSQAGLKNLHVWVKNQDVWRIEKWHITDLCIVTAAYFEGLFKNKFTAYISVILGVNVWNPFNFGCIYFNYFHVFWLCWAFNDGRWCQCIIFNQYRNIFSWRQPIVFCTLCTHLYNFRNHF